MNKADLVTKVAERANITKKEATDIIETVLGAVEDTLIAGNEVKLQGFGTFKVSSRNAREGRNPQTGEKIQIKPARVPKFTASKVLKDKMK